MQKKNTTTGISAKDRWQTLQVLISDDYPFALIKYLDKNFDKNHTFVSENGTFKILVPTWLKI